MVARVTLKYAKPTSLQPKRPKNFAAEVSSTVWQPLRSMMPQIESPRFDFMWYDLSSSS